MKIAVIADTTQQQAFLTKRIPADASIYWLQPGENIPEADAYFDLRDESAQTTALSPLNEAPVFINAVIRTSAELPNNAIRINAWNGFLQRPLVEIAGNGASVAKAGPVLQKLDWAFQIVPDTPGMISARVIAMIINEAYFGLGEGISTKQEIDTAMKLGTNYPYGPFEWSEKIGLKNIHALLQKLGENSTRYAIAPKLAEELALLINK